MRGKIIHEIETIEKLKCLTHDETVLHTLDPVIKRAVQFVADESHSVVIYQFFVTDLMYNTHAY